MQLITRGITNETPVRHGLRLWSLCASAGASMHPSYSGKPAGDFEPNLTRVSGLDLMVRQ